MPLHAHADHDHGADAPRDQRRIAMAASLGIAVLMLVGKLVAFSLTGSTAILSDALESVIHVVATAIAAFSLWYAAQPPDPAHPYGHGKIAYFSSAFEGALILVAALGIAYAAVEALITGPELEQLGLGLLITAGLAAVNAVLGFSLIRIGKRTNAIVLVANGQHVLTDMWTSLGVLVGVGLVWATGVEWLDPVVALLVGLNIVWTAWRLLRRSYEGLMEKADAADSERLIETLRTAQAAGVLRGWHHLRHRRVNDQVWVEVHLLFEPDLPLHEAHRRATAVETDLRAHFPKDDVLVTSHLEPETHEHPELDRHEPFKDALTE
ncbi:MAG: cation diffusion facilitator family transporter [Rhodothermales bacterium]|nr:cation diffusion facilitator family transporter [Rhodothermales bacterium]